jgi:hypothetical protein
MGIGVSLQPSPSLPYLPPLVLSVDLILEFAGIARRDAVEMVGISLCGVHAL